MNLSHLLFVILLAMCGIVATAFVIGESPTKEIVSSETGAVTVATLGHGIPHPRYQTMLAGGDGADRHRQILWIGWAFGISQVALFVGLMAFGGQKNRRLGPLRIPLAIGGVVYVIAFTGMVYTYQSYMLDDSHTMFLALPIPTAWMLYGVWPVPLIFVVLFMFTFDKWTFRDDDMVRFKEILAEKNAATGDRL